MEVDLRAGEGRVGVPETGCSAEVGEAGVDAYAGACCDEEGVGLIEQRGGAIDWRCGGEGRGGHREMLQTCARLERPKGRTRRDVAVVSRLVGAAYVGSSIAGHSLHFSNSTRVARAAASAVGSSVRLSLSPSQK